MQHFKIMDTDKPLNDRLSNQYIFVKRKVIQLNAIEDKFLLFWQEIHH